MTVNELIEQLKTLPPNLPVYATWEGVFVEIKKENIDLASSLDRTMREYEEDNRLSRFIKYHNSDGVIIDVDQE